MLVVGASGLVGTAAVERLLADGADVIAVSRRAPELAGRGNQGPAATARPPWRSRARPFEHDARPTRPARRVMCAAAAAGWGHVTHVVYAAVHELPGLVGGWVDPVQMLTNLAMLCSCRTAVASAVRCATLACGGDQGLRRARAPHPHPGPRGWREPRITSTGCTRTTSASRPVGHRLDVHDLAPAADRRPEPRGRDQPGPRSSACTRGDVPRRGTPVRLPRWGVVGVGSRSRAIARLYALAWAASTPAVARLLSMFNITNGEVFEWRDMWPAIADVVGVETGPDEPLVMFDLPPGEVRPVGPHRGRARPPPHRAPDLLGESHFYAHVCFVYGVTASPPARPTEPRNRA